MEKSVQQSCKFVAAWSLKKTRKKLADVIRKRGINENDEDSEEYDEAPVIPLKKRKNVRIKIGKKRNKRRKNFNLYEEFEDV